MISGATASILTYVVTWFLTRKKQEVDVSKVELENVAKVIEIWRELAERLTIKVELLTKEVDRLTDRCETLSKDLDRLNHENKSLKRAISAVK
ncbi:MAG: hypothetical protein K2Q03_10320 [Sphingobacteriaceae bacterium]|nr:hypothetical protein [Sphingobacteriaceae bacterium]